MDKGISESETRLIRRKADCAIDGKDIVGSVNIELGTIPTLKIGEQMKRLMMLVRLN